MREPVELPPPPSPAQTSMVGRPLGEILRAVAGLSEAALDEALRAQTDEGGRLGEVLVARKAVTSEDVAKALALQPHREDEGLLGEVDRHLPHQLCVDRIERDLRHVGKVQLEGEAVALLVADPL